MPLTVIKSTGIANTESYTFGAANITGNLTVFSVTNLGGVSNVRITGGIADYVLRTDGSGNLSWVAQTGGGGSAIPIQDDLTSVGTFYPLFANTTTGNLTSVNVSSTELTFQPSTGSLSAMNFISLSDQRYKKNVITISNASEIINRIDGVSFNWVKNDKPAYGVIAQEVEKVLPDIVSTNEEGFKTVNYDSFIPFLIQIIKEQSQEIEKLKEQIVTINRKIGN